MNDTSVGDVRCKHCGCTNVYWMTVLGRREAEFIAKSNPRALKLAQARLFNLDGGEHVCQTTADGFEDQPV